MKKLLTIIFLVACSFSAVTGQDYQQLSWNDKPTLHTIPEDYKKESAVVVLDQRYLEVLEEKKEFVIYRTVHRIIRVLDDKGIESFNKISIGATNDHAIERVSARTILSGGKQIVVEEGKIKESTDEDGSKVLAFAMEGVEKNSEVEILYTEKRKFSLFGTESFQFSIPVMTADFRLTTPSRLRFETKGYNDFPTSSDTTLNQTNIYRAVASLIPGVEAEPYSNYNAAMMRIDYRLSFVDGENANVRLFTWNDMAKRLYSSFYEYTEKDKKAVKNYLQGIGVTESMSELQKIKKIEDVIKSTISISEDIADESYLRFDRIIEKKITTEEGFTRFFVACFREAGIDFEVGMSSNRFNFPFDEKFENWKLLDFYLLYLPGQKMYIAPSSPYYRMPIVPPAVLGNKAVFTKLTSIGEMTSAIAKIRTIPPPAYDISGSDVDATISFLPDMTPEVDITHSFKGYSAAGLREGFVYISKDKEKELVQQIIDIASRPEEITSYKVDNASFTSYYDNLPLKIQAKVNASELLEKAGSKYIFKVGDVIGKQSEMYQEKQRKLPIDLPFPHSLLRTIVVNIPDGYKLANPEAVRMKVEGKNAAGVVTEAFISDYRMDGRKMVISIEENYKELHYPVSEIEPFKNVINAAADFNKVALVLEKN